ncbi:hypothetical protein PZH42_30605, partial [Bacteroides cellulosilyticus]|nr:hypothetical protein [Bacteroides cellulosilyticus]
KIEKQSLAITPIVVKQNTPTRKSANKQKGTISDIDGKLPQRLMPIAERNQFAVEISLPTGTAVEKTGQIADSLEHIELHLRYQGCEAGPLFWAHYSF